MKRLTFPTEKHERIMEHPRKALQGLDDDLIHRDMPRFPGLGFLDGYQVPPKIHFSPLQVELLGRPHPRVQSYQHHGDTPWGRIGQQPCFRSSLPGISGSRFKLPPI